jgi:yecA family protein
MLLQENECKVDGKPIALDFFHGYMQAVVLTPEPLSANEWMPEIFAGKMPEFGSVDEANDVLAVLMGFYNRLNQLRLEKMCGAPGRAVH